MAQIIKHRRGSIASIKDVTANVGELVMATGSIGDLTAPVLFVGDTAVAGGYKPVSKIYNGSTAPVLGGSYGSTLNGTPFYSSDSQSLYILSNSGNINMDLSGNLEGNLISGITINALTASFVSASNRIEAATGSFQTINIGTIGFSGLTEGRLALVGPDGSIVDSGSLNFNNGQLGVSGSIKLNDDAYIYNDGALVIEDNNNGIYINSNNYSELHSNDNYVYLENGYNEIYSAGSTDIYGNGTIQLYAQSGNLDMWANDGTVYLTNNTNNSSIDINGRNGSTTNINTQQGANVGDVYILSNQGNQLFVQGNTHLQSTVYIDNALSMYHDGAFYMEDTDNTGMYIQSANFTRLGQIEGTAHFYTENNYAEMYSANGLDVYANNGSVGIYNNDGNVWISSYNDTLYLNQDGGEGDVRIGNGSNALYSNNTSIELSASSDAGFYYSAGLLSNNVTVNPHGSELYTNYDGDISGVSTRPNKSVEVTGSFYINNNFAFHDDKLQLGNGNFEVDATTGDIRTTGSITMKGNITIGDNIGGDVVSLGAEISSSLIPSGTLVFDIGSGTNKWNNIYAGSIHADNIDLNTISFSGLTENRVVYVGPTGSLVDSGNFTFNGYTLQTNIDVVELKAGDYAELNWNNSNYVYVNSNGAYVESSNGNTYLEAYNGNIELSNDSGAQIHAYGQSYFHSNVHIDDNRTLYVTQIWDNTDGDNYLNLFGNPNNSGWWSSNNNADTSLVNTLSNENLNIIKINSGNVNIDATNGSVNLHSANGFNVTGSMVVSDGSGVFNSSLIVNNSDLTLDGGSNQHMNDGAHLYFDTCVDIYWNNNSGNLVFYNDCNSFEFQQNVYADNNLYVSGYTYINNDLWVTGNTRSNNYRGLDYSDSALHLNGGTYGAPHVELTSVGQISLFSEGGGINYAINLTGSVYAKDDVYLNNNNTLYANYIGDYENNGLTIHPQGNLILQSLTSRYVNMSVANDESGTNYVYVDGTNGVGLQTYDITSNLEHSVVLDNTGSLKLTNVDLKISGSLNVNGNSTFDNDLTVKGDMYVSGNFTILGTGSQVYITASQVDIGTNKIILNTYAPFERFAGIDVYDSGSNAGVTGSLLWDSQNNVWIYANPSGSAYASARFIAGPMNTGSLGEETGLTVGHIPVAVGDDHIGDSPLTYIGTTLALNTNKFTVDSSNGDTVILGNLTIHGVGATDNGEASSYVVFRNSDDEIGFINPNDSGNQLDQLLGYNNATGNLEFSSLIDGGTY